MYQKTFNECNLSKSNVLGVWFIKKEHQTPFSLTGNANKGIYFYSTADKLSCYKLNKFPFKIVYLPIVVLLGGIHCPTNKI